MKSQGLIRDKFGSATNSETISPLKYEEFCYSALDQSQNISLANTEQALTGRQVNFSSQLRPIIEMSAEKSDHSNNITPHKPELIKIEGEIPLPSPEKASSSDTDSILEQSQIKHRFSGTHFKENEQSFHSNPSLPKSPSDA